VEYGGITEFLSRLKARGHALMAKCGQDMLLAKNGKQKDLSSLSSWMQWQWQWASQWSLERVKNGSRKRVHQVM